MTSDTGGGPVTVTMGDLVALERHLGRPVVADNGSALISVESAAWLTWRHRGGDGQTFDQWLDNGAGELDFTGVVKQAAALLGFDPDAGGVPATADPSIGGVAPPPD
jgi:hypothetical protein